MLPGNKTPGPIFFTVVRDHYQRFVYSRFKVQKHLMPWTRVLLKQKRPLTFSHTILETTVNMDYFSTVALKPLSQIFKDFSYLNHKTGGTMTYLTHK